MKLTKKELSTAIVGFLYPDGHMKIRHEKYDKNTKKNKYWVNIWESVGVVPHIENGHCLVMWVGMLQFLPTIKGIHYFENEKLKTFHIVGEFGSIAIYENDSVPSSYIRLEEGKERFSDIIKEKPSALEGYAVSTIFLNRDIFLL
jgi:hypothetical protein